MTLYERTREQMRWANGHLPARRRVANNTYLEMLADDAIAVRLHDTDVVVIFPDDVVVLNSGSWRTMTTRDRINRFAGPFSIVSERRRADHPVGITRYGNPTRNYSVWVVRHDSNWTPDGQRRASWGEGTERVADFEDGMTLDASIDGANARRESEHDQQWTCGRCDGRIAPIDTDPNDEDNGLVWAHLGPDTNCDDPAPRLNLREQDRESYSDTQDRENYTTTDWFTLANRLLHDHERCLNCDGMVMRLGEVWTHEEMNDSCPNPEPDLTNAAVSPDAVYAGRHGRCWIEDRHIHNADGSVDYPGYLRPEVEEIPLLCANDCGRPAVEEANGPGEDGQWYCLHCN